MNGRLLFLNLALVVALSATGWKLWANYVSDRDKHNAFLHRNQGAAPVTPHTASEPAKPVQAASYLQVAQQMLFAKDRNPNVIIEIEAAPPPPPPPPVPPFPAAYGIIGFGGDVVVLLGENGKQKGFRLGDSVGQFKLSAIKGDELTFEWNGQEFKKTMAELKKLGTPASATATTEAKPATNASDSATSTTNFATRADGMPVLTRVTPDDVYKQQLKVDGGPGLAAGGGPDRNCDPNDKSPAGTVNSGYRKVLTASPFGAICRWEPVR